MTLDLSKYPDLVSRDIREGDKPNELLLFDHGFVRLDSAMADDLSVVNSARVSFAVRKEEMDDRDMGLIRFLMRAAHGSPFEHNSFRFHIRCPIFVVREWMRHRVSSFNEESARYHQLEADFYVPEVHNVRSQVGKPGAYSFEPVDDDLANETRGRFEQIYREVYKEYEEMLEQGVAKEVARAILPVGIYTQFYWTVNARSMMNFLALRNAESAQYEIRTYAKAVERLFAERMPLTHECFVEFGRTCP
ncbi:MAG: FAD-dependent thymidylate synthase [Actinobacteria bacterium]|jgi:thymidylate synthase (FAD)|nr:FAD-dependent thymidylate synthase [Actinomycetota bacterium]